MFHEWGRRVHCTKCGFELTRKMRFCPNCGAVIDATPLQRSTYPNVLGFISAGVILILVALTYLRYPFVFSTFVNYVKNMINRQAYIKPPQPLFDSAIFFFNACGAWGVVLSVMRIVFQKSVKKALEDFSGGLLSFSLAFLLTNYAANFISGRTTLGYFVIAIGVVILANAVYAYALSEKRRFN